MCANRICNNKTLLLGTKLKRDEALSFLKEVLSESPYTSPEAVILNQTKGPDSYTVNIKETFSSQTVKDIARKHNLLVKEEKNAMVVYTPTT